MRNFLLFTTFIFSQLSLAQGALTGKWTTGYIHQAGIVTVEFEGNEVTITIDPNTCVLNAIGEPKACGVMGLGTVKSQLILDQETSRQFPRGTSLYRVAGTDLGIVSFKNIQASWMRFVRFHPENKELTVFATPLLPN